MKPSIKRDVNEASAAIERLAEIMPRCNEQELIDFAARAKGLDAAITRLRDASKEKVIPIIEKMGDVDPLNPNKRRFIGEEFLGNLTMVSSSRFDQTAFKVAHSDLFEKFSKERAEPRLTFDVR